MLKYFGGACFEKQRCQDAKRQGLLRFELFKEIYKFLSLNLRNILISLLEGEKKFLSELCELRNFREGYNLKYSCPAQHETVLEPSPAFVMLTGVRKRLLPLTKREGCDSVISSDFKSKISITNENNLFCKELSALVPQYLSNFSETVFSRFTSLFSRKCTAFTLAEVLITLGIIGIVASMTLPSVIHNYKIKQLRTGFLRSSSMIQNALNQTANEFGYSNYKELNSICGNVGKGDSASACKNENDTLFKEINADFLSRFKGLKTMKSTNFWSLKNNTTNFSGTTKFNYGDLYGITGWGGTHASAYFVVDGTLITSIAFYYHEPSDGLSISFDTNGPYKGPNRYGYDIFLFNTGTWYKFCSQKSDGLSGLYNGRGCYDYALKDVNPDDNTKGYWESLK